MPHLDEPHRRPTRYQQAIWAAMAVICMVMMVVIAPQPLDAPVSFMALLGLIGGYSTARVIDTAP